jgi:hypothetical protein
MIVIAIINYYYHPIEILFGMTNLYSNVRQGYPQIRKGDKMTNNKVENYIESDSEKTQGHLDTRQKNFECENPDERLGCDLGIDVAG